MRATAIISIGVVALMLPACGGDAGVRSRTYRRRVPSRGGFWLLADHVRRNGAPGCPDRSEHGASGQFVDHGVQISQALKLVLADRGWRAGEYRVGLQLCDETTAASSDDSDPAERGAARAGPGARRRVRGALLVRPLLLDRYGDTTLTAIGLYRVEEGRLRFETAIAPAAELLARR